MYITPNNPKYKQTLRDNLKKKIQRDAWVAQSVKHPTLDFSSGHDLPVKGSSPT